MQLSNIGTKSTCTVGELRHFFTAWHQITNESIALEIIKSGLKIDFQERPRMTNVPKTSHCGKDKSITNLVI